MRAPHVRPLPLGSVLLTDEDRPAGEEPDSEAERNHHLEQVEALGFDDVCGDEAHRNCSCAGRDQPVQYAVENLEPERLRLRERLDECHADTS